MTRQELLSTLDTALTYPRVHKPKSASPRFGVTRALGRKPAHLLLAPSCWAMQAHQALGYPRSCLAALCLSACFFPNYSFVHVFFKRCLGTEESELKDTNWWNILIFCHSLCCSAICPGWVLENFHHPQFPDWEWATQLHVQSHAHRFSQKWRLSLDLRAPRLTSKPLSTQSLQGKD